MRAVFSASCPVTTMYEPTKYPMSSKVTAGMVKARNTAGLIPRCSPIRSRTYCTFDTAAK